SLTVFILERSSAGRIAARARGRYGGRPEKLNKQDLKLLKTLYDNGTPIKTIAEQWKVSRTTIYIVSCFYGSYKWHVFLQVQL
ncbi:helix-turn-helix domain-containing protein, partial [Staphylococcus aureus]